MDPSLKLTTSATFEQAMKMCLPFRNTWSVTTKLQVLLMLASKAPSESHFTELLQNKQYVELRSSMMASVDLIDSNYLVRFLHFSASSNVEIVDPEVLDAIGSELSKERNLVDLSDRSLGLISRSMVKLAGASCHTGVLDSVMTEIIKRINNKTLLECSCLSDICWSFDAISRLPSRAVEPILDYVSANMDTVDARSLSRIIWAMQNSCIFSDLPKPLEDASVRIIKKAFLKEYVDGASTSALVTLLDSLGKSSFYSRDFFDCISECILSGKVDSRLTSSRFLCLVLYSYLKACYYDPAVMDYLAQKALNIVDNFNCHDITKIVQAYGYLNHRQEEIVNAVTDRLMHLYYGGFSSMTVLISTMHHVAWSGLVFGMVSPRLFNICMDTKLLRDTGERVCVV